MPEISIINCDPEVRKNTAQVLLRLATTITPQFSTNREENVVPSYALDYAGKIMKNKTREGRERLINEIREVAETTQSMNELFWTRLFLRFEKENKMNRLIKAILAIRHDNLPIDMRVSSIVSNPYKFVTKLKEVL